MNNREMSALVPYSRGSRSSQIPFGSHKQRSNQHYDRRIIGQQPFIPRFYPIIPNYQPSFFPMQGYPPNNFNQFGRSAISTDLISFNQPNRHHQYAQFIHHIDEVQKGYWKQRANTMPVLPKHADAFPSYNRPNKLYGYEKETRYLPYPVYAPGVSGFGNNRNLGYSYQPNPGLIGGFNNNITNVGGIRNLPPKVRVIFMPPGLSSPPQPCSGALAMPPFAFNRMSQPLCSLPLPPPLPQIASLPLSPVVQQMVAQQYANPIAVLPFTSNWPSSQSMMSGCLPISQQQQSQFMISPLNLQPQQSIPQSFIPPTSLSANMPIFSANPPSFPFAFDATPSSPQYSNNNFPSVCRACIPPPPLLNVSVASHNLTQQCSACHHGFTDASKPNIRPNNGRSTPLLRQPITIQNPYNLPKQSQRYSRNNGSFASRPWAHKMPSLPQGAVIISDQYFPIPRKNSAKTYKFSQKYSVQHPRVFTSASRSVSLGASSANTNTRTTNGSRTQSQRKYQDSISQSRSKSTSITPLSHLNASKRHRSPSSFSSSSSSCSSCAVCNPVAVNENPKSDIQAQNSQKHLARKQLSAAARNINIRYNYQIPDLPSVYNNNRYLKSSDTDSTSPSQSSSPPNSFMAKEYRNNRPPSPVYLNSIEEEDEEERRTVRSFSTTSFQTPQPVTKTVIIRRFTAPSPSASTISADSTLDRTENDVDPISMTTTIQTDQSDEETEEEISETF